MHTTHRPWGVCLATEDRLLFSPSLPPCALGPPKVVWPSPAVQPGSQPRATAVGGGVRGWGSSVSTYKLPSLSLAARGVSKAAPRAHRLEFGSRKVFWSESQVQVQMGLRLSSLSCVPQ